MAKATSEEILASEHSSLLVDLRYVKSDQVLSSSEDTLEEAEALMLLQEQMIVALKSTLAAVRAELDEFRSTLRVLRIGDPEV